MTYSPFNKSNRKRDPKSSLTSQALYGRRGKAGGYDEMLYGDAGVLEKTNRMRNLLASMDLTIKGAQGETPEEQAFRERCMSILLDARQARDNHTSMNDMLVGLSDAVLRGFAVWNAWFEEDPHTEWGYRLRFYKIHASTITEWVFDDDGFVLGLQQDTVNGSVVLANDEMVRVTPWDDEGPEGIAMLRPLLFLFEIKKQILFEMGRRASTQAGLAVAKQNQQADEQAVVQLIDDLDSLMSGEQSFQLLPHGYELELLNLPTGMDLLPVVHYVDDKISQMFDDLLSTLSTSAYGSRALGEVLMEESDWASGVLLAALLKSFSRALFAFIADKLSYTGRLPSLEPSIDDSLGAQEVLARATQVSSLVGLREADENTLRQHAGLAPRESAGKKIESQVASPSPFMFHKDNGCSTTPKRFMLQRDPQVPKGYDEDIEWEKIVIDREQAENKLYAETTRLINDIRQDFRNGTARQESWLPIIEDVYYDYFMERRQAMAELAAREAQSQVNNNRVEEFTASPTDWLNTQAFISDAITQLTTRYTNRLAAQAELAARNLWRRLEQEQQEIEVYGRQDLPTQADAKALSQDAKHASRISEQLGRFEGALGTEATGLLPVRLIRSGFEDIDRCDHCESQAGFVVDLLTTPVDEIPVLPDPLCAGTASRCRCGWLVIYGRRPENT